RGRRGGKRHRRKPPGTGAATAAGEQPSGTAAGEQPSETAPGEDGAEATPKPRAPRAQGQRQPRPRQPRQPRQPKPTEASAATPTIAEQTGADTDLAASTDEAAPDGKPAAPKRRR